MDKKFVWIIIAVVFVSGGLLWYVQRKDDSAGTANSTSMTGSEHNSTSGSADTNSVPTATNTVSIQDFAFSPSRITVKKGTTVTWTNKDSVGHNVIAKDSGNTGGLPTSAALLSQGETFSHTFDQTGTFSYRCQPHPQMLGTVEVIE